MFWWIIIGIGGALSAGTLNPVFIVGALVITGVCRWVERPWVKEVQAAGRNPDLPPAPTTGLDCAGCLLWFITMTLALFFLVVVVMAVLEGRIAP